MKKNLLPAFPAAFLLVALAVVQSGCRYNHAYFQSPYNGNIEAYHTMPMRSDSIRSAIYASGSFTVGTANERMRDNQYYFTGALHRSHNFSGFQAYYGANASLGMYRVSSMSGLAADGVNLDQINKNAGRKSFGGYGISGGINRVIPLGNSLELRVPQLSFTWQKESGNYFNFRENLPDTAANTIFKGREVATLGLGLELALKMRHRVVCSRLMAGGNLVNQGDCYAGSDQTNHGMAFFSWTNTIIKSNTTFFWQLNFGNHAFGVQCGVQYRLGAAGQ